MCHALGEEGGGGEEGGDGGEGAAGALVLGGVVRAVRREHRGHLVAWEGRE